VVDNVGTEMQFLVLGPLEAHGDRGPVAVGGGRQRALLALLLVHAGEVISRDRLIDELWSGEPPASASQSLDAYLSRLRKAFREAGASDVVVTRAPGYALQAAGTDAARFASLVREGRAALRAGEAERGVALLAEALAMWRGPAYAEFADEPWARAEAGRLEELRLAAAEDRIEVELALGRHAALVAELEVLAADHPTRERLVGQLILALYRSGRQADALAAYRKARRALVDELGLEPGRELRDLEAAILAQDAALDLPRESRPPPVTVPTEPQRHRRRALLAGLAAAAALALAAIVVIGGPGGGQGGRGMVAGDGAGAVDPRTGRVEVSVHVGSGPAGVASSNGKVWVTNAADGTVTRIDAAAGHVDQTIPVGTSPAGIAAGAGAIWVANSLDGSVSRIDPELARVVQTIHVGRRPVALAVGGGSVWVADADGDTIVPLDARSGIPRTPVRVSDSPRGIAFGLGALWVTEPLAHRLLRIDPTDGSITDAIGVGGGAGPVAVGAGAVWVVNTLDGTLSRIDPATDGVTSTVTIGRAPTGVAVSDSSVWVSDAGSGELVSVDPRTGFVRRRYQIGAAPAAVTIAGATPWVAASPLGAAHRGGTLRVEYSPFDMLDPALPNDVHPAIWRATGDGLVAVIEDSGAAQLAPDLATAVPQPTDNGTTYTFHLRPGLRYSTGIPVRASDVRRELERLFIAGSDLAGSMGALRGAAACTQQPATCDLSPGVTTDDRTRTIVFHLSRPDPELLFKLASPSARPVPPDTPRAPTARPIPSTGPYRVGAFEPGRRLLLVRNPRFHEWSQVAQPDGFPDQIEITMNPDPQARVQAVLAGRSDLALEVASANLTPLRTRFASQLRLHSQPHTSFLTFNTRRPPFTDVRARQAVNLALDRATLARQFGGPGLSTPTCQVLPRNFPGHEDYCPWTQRPHDGRWHGSDLRRARALVRATGTKGATITFLTHRGDDIGPAAAPVVMTALRAIGYRARALILSDASFGPEVGAGRWNIGDGDWVADYPSPGQFFSFLTCASATNGGSFCDPALDRLVARADRLQLDDPATAQALWARADRRAVDLAPWAPIVSNTSVELLSPRTSHFTLDASSLPQIDQLWVR
jgi:YVTN family beta-propeller protein